MNLQLPLILESLVNNIVLTQQWNNLWSLFEYLVLIFTASGLFSMIRTLIVQYVGNNVIYSVRGDMFKALQAQSYSFYDKNRTGDIMSKTTNDVNIMNNFMANDFGNVIRDSITLIIILFEVFNLNVELSFIFLSVTPLLFGLMIWYRKHMRPTYYKMAVKAGELTSVLQENISGVRVVKAFGREKFEMEKYQKVNAEFLKKNMDVIRLSTNYGPLQSFITSSASVLLLILGGYLVLNNMMTLGAVVAFYAYFSYLYSPIQSITTFFSNFSQVQASLTRINSILENKSEIEEKPDALSIPDLNGHYSFQGVWFSYENDEHYVLRDINLDVRSGERIAILGATGSGKSTLINLIPRFYDPSKGDILVDGINLKDLKIDDYRRQIGIVSQDVFLFSQSIAENISYGKLGKVKQEDIESVAKLAAIHNFIISLPDGYKTKVGERGQTLSGGQKQRVAIARALLLDPRVLIMDDSLSAVDIDTETQIQQALDNLAQRRTTFIITQRISTVQNCDRILVLDNGSIMELGTHEELYAKNGIYTRVYNTMFKAQTKPKPVIAPIETLFESLSPIDAKTVDNFYEEKYPDEEKRIKAQTKKIQQIEKEKLKEEKTETKKAKKIQNHEGSIIDYSNDLTEKDPEED